MDFVMIKTMFQIVNMIMTIAVVWMTHMHTIIVKYVSANLMRQIIQFLLKQNLLLNTNQGMYIETGMLLFIDRVAADFFG